MSSKIHLIDLIAYLWSRKIAVVGFTALVSAITVVWLLSLPDKYTAQTVFQAETRQNEGGLTNIASSLGGMASLAGISLGSSSETEIEAEYLLMSDTFLLSVVKDFGFLPEVVAAERYDFNTDSTIYDLSLYDPSKAIWMLKGDIKSREGEYPANWYVASKLREMVSLAKDDETNLLTLKVEHVSPDFATEFSRAILSEINRVMKERESSRLARRLEFLSEQLVPSAPSEIRQSIYSLVEQQLKQKMILETTDDFVFKIIEPPSLPEIKSSPLRAVLLLLACIAAGASALLFYVFKFIFDSYKKELV